uniref:Transcriptional corepressor SEUSS n=1 Tax=Oryza barthii TaxID=65489 RepID=A0A0D3HJC8_9ORYZ
MMPSGPLNPMGPGQPVGAAASLLRTSSSLLSGGQQGMGSGGGMIPSQSPFSSLVSPRTQFGANGLLGGGSNVSSLLNRPFGNGGHMLGPGLMPGGGGIPMNTLQQQRGGLDGAGDLVGVGGSDPLSFPSSSQVSLGNQLGSDNLHQPPQHQQQQQQLDAMHDLQQQQQHQQLPMSYNQQHLPPQPPQQPQATVKLENGGSTGGVKLEPQMGQPDQNSSAQMMRNASNVKIEPQQLQALRSLSAVKMEQPTSDPSAFLQQQQQQQHLLQLTKQNPQAAAAAQLNLLQQQRILQMQQQQQQQQQQILKNLPLQRNQLQQQQLLRQQSLNMRTPGKSAPYEPGTCAKRLTHYMITILSTGEILSMSIFLQMLKRGGVYLSMEVVAKLLEFSLRMYGIVRYAIGSLGEALNASGQIVLDYTKAIQESVFEQLRVVREGHLRIVFNPDLKIASWEFCARRHEELIPRRSIIPQVSQLGAVVQKYQSADNNIEYWRNFVNEYFSPNAKKRWCVSLYGSGRQTTGVFPQDVWHCEICNRKPGRGFETTVEVLPRLCQIKYASGTLEELLYVDMPRESQNASGQIVLDYTKAIQESVFEQLRVIASWEFCARRHEELIPRRSIIPQVSQLGAVVQKYQSAVQNSTNLSTQDMQNNCNSFVACARQLAKALEVPLVNDLGYTKRYVRCLQIAEVVNCMKDLIDYSRQNGSGPIASLHSFPRRTSSGVSPHQSQQQQPEEQQSIPQSSNQSGQNAAPMTGVQASASANADVTSNNSLSCAPSTSAPSPSVVGLLQGSMNSRQDHPMSSANGPYTSGNSAAIPKVNSTTSLQSNPSTSFPSPMPTTSNNNMMPAPQSTNQLSSPTTSSNLPPMQPPATRPQEPEPNESQSSVQRILQDLMMSPQMNGIGQLGNDMKRPNGLTSSVNGVNCLVGNAVTNNSGMGGMGGMGFGAMGGLGPNHAASGLRTAMVNNAMAISGRMGMNHSAHDLSQLGQLQQQQQHQQQQQQQQHDLGNQLLNGLRAANSFNNLQYDWKPSQ